MPEKNSKYYHATKIPVRVIIGREKQKLTGFYFNLSSFLKKNLKIVGFLTLVLAIISVQSLLFQAYEAHVINVTAHICRSSETRTPGYWKTHEEVTIQFLPQTLGDESIETFEEAFDILDSNAEDMRSKLMSHLLAMKFNIAYYGVGDYQYYVESHGSYLTINEIVAWADDLLRDPDAKRKDLEEVKDILDYLNNLHQLRFCGTIIPTIVQSFQFTEEELVTEEATTGEEVIIEEEMMLTERVVVQSCETESQQLCFTSLLGICAAGAQTCTAEGLWGECIQDNQPIDEICNNQLDDDCDGLTDCDDEFCAEDLTCQAALPEGEPSTSTEPILEEEPPVEEPPAEEPPAEEPPAEEPPAEEPPAEEPPAEEPPPVEEPPPAE